jgi:hypothetical protein
VPVFPEKASSFQFCVGPCIAATVLQPHCAARSTKSRLTGSAMTSSFAKKIVAPFRSSTTFHGVPAKTWLRSAMKDSTPQEADFPR